MDERNNYESLIEELPKLTFGQQLVGVTFNPSGDDKVNDIKKTFAHAADVVFDHYCRDAYSEKSEMEKLIYKSAISDILNAQMKCVKLLTFKY